MTSDVCPECHHKGTRCLSDVDSDCMVDGQHKDGCPCLAAKECYWAQYFGQDYGTREEKRARLEAWAKRRKHDE